MLSHANNVIIITVYITAIEILKQLVN